MANSGFELGWNAMQQSRDLKRNRKQALEDEERKNSFDDLRNQRNNLQMQIRALDPEKNPEDRAKHEELSALADKVQLQMNDLFHPIRHPGALQRMWPYVWGHITRKSPEVQPSDAPFASVATASTPDVAITPSTFKSTPGLTAALLPPGTPATDVAAAANTAATPAAPAAKTTSTAAAATPATKTAAPPTTAATTATAPAAKSTAPAAAPAPTETATSATPAAPATMTATQSAMGAPWAGTPWAADPLAPPSTAKAAAPARTPPKIILPPKTVDPELVNLPADGASVTLPGSTTKVTGPGGPDLATSETMAVPTTSVKGLVATGNIPIWNRPRVENDDGSFSSEYSISYTDENPKSPYYGKEVLIPTVVNGKFLTPDGKKPAEGSAEEEAMKAEAWKHYEQTGEQLGVFDDPKHADKYAGVLHSRGDRKRPNPASYQTAYERKLQARKDRAHEDAQQFLAAGPLTPAQEAQLKGAESLATISQSIKDWKAARASAGMPEATPEETSAFFSDLIANRLGFTQQKAIWKQYQYPDGTKTWLDASRPDLIPAGVTAVGSETADTRKRADFAAYKQQHPDYTGTFEQWVAEQPLHAKNAVPTNRDDRYIQIEQAKAMGKPVSEDDLGYAAAYDLYIKKRVVGPIEARAASRFIQVMDPANPENVILMSAGEAAKAKVGTPASIAFQIDKAMTRYMTSGKGGETINYFNTSISHLNLLSEVADALNNSDVQLANSLGNAFATAFGGPAPTNFLAVKNAVAGELSKTFAGKSATVDEIRLMNETISSMQSPAQLHGAINYYIGLMNGKLSGLQAQNYFGKMGLPAFMPSTGDIHGVGKPQPKTGGGAPTSFGFADTFKGPKGGISLSKAMAARKALGWSEDQVINDLHSKGYSYVRP